MGKLNRGELLRLGVAGALGIGAAGAASSARAATPAPAGDDIGFVQWGATAELVSVAFWDQAIAADRLGARGRRWMGAMRVADIQHLAGLSSVLGEEAPTGEDFEVVLPERAFATRAGILALGAEVEDAVTRAYLAGIAETGDPGTRLLLGKLLVQDVGHLDAIGSLGGSSSAFAGRRGPLELEQAGTWLDRHLRLRSS